MWHSKYAKGSALPVLSAERILCKALLIPSARKKYRLLAREEIRSSNIPVVSLPQVHSDDNSPHFQSSQHSFGLESDSADMTVIFTIQGPQPDNALRIVAVGAQPPLMISPGLWEACA
jgi:hypothetical protein